MESGHGNLTRAWASASTKTWWTGRESPGAATNLSASGRPRRDEDCCASLGRPFPSLSLSILMCAMVWVGLCELRFLPAWSLWVRSLSSESPEDSQPTPH